MVPQEHANSRSVNDQIRFCGTVCLTAAQIGILIVEKQDNNSTYFEWFDTISNRRIKGELKLDRQTALENACDRLIDYLNEGNQ
jgi:hypothetical protein